ncbi:MAG: molybdopterin cofactor-binding domain-containing protein [Polyangiales bacterium]
MSDDSNTMDDADGDTSAKKSNAKKKLSRRQFIVRGLAGGTGVLMGVGYLGRNSIRRAVFSAEMPPSFSGDTEDPLMWFEVEADNRVRLYSPKVEMGQGTFTGMAQIAADELEVDVTRIDVLHASSDRGNLDFMSTGGSLSIAGLWLPLRELAATMREMLRIEAARQMGVEASTLSIDDGTFSSRSETKTYGEVAASMDVWNVPDTPPLKDVSDYRFVGQPIKRVDLEAKVFGDPIFGMDAMAEDMVYGSVLRPSMVGATLASVDTDAAAAMPGVIQVVVENDFVGVVAETRMLAERAKEAVVAEWVAEHVWETAHVDELVQVGRGTDTEIQLEGDAASILDDAEADGADGFFRAEYRSPIGAHAQMEPNGAVADVREDHATITLSTQVVKVTRDEIAERLGFEPERVKVVPTYLGGGFGRRLHTPNAIQAAVLSRAVGRPVKCFFTRKEEFQSDTFRPPTHHVMRAKVSAEGRIEAIEHQVASGDVMFGSPMFPPIAATMLRADAGALVGGLIHYHTVPNIRAVTWGAKLPFRTSFWRALGLLANTFAIESFLDEIATATEQDPVQMRLDMIPNDEPGERLRGVIEAAVERHGGYRDSAENGRAMGFACSSDGSNPAAHIVEVARVGGRVRVEKVTCAFDPGFAVNPDQVKAQCEGSVMMGLSAAMYERMELIGGELKPTIYGPYRMALMRDAPREIDVVLVQGSDEPGRVGEPPMGPIGAAIANAMFRLSGERIREIPLAAAEGLGSARDLQG